VQFLDFLWLIIVAFAFLAYLMLLWTILTDLFRDHDLSGWAKAVWVVFLFIIPLLTSLVYLIVRGGGMAKRAQVAEQAFETAQQDYIRSIAGTSPTAQIAEAKALLDSGAITESEFEHLKNRALS